MFYELMSRDHETGNSLAGLNGAQQTIHETSGLIFPIIEESVIDLIALFEAPRKFHVPQGGKIPSQFIAVYRKCGADFHCSERAVFLNQIKKFLLLCS